MKYSKFINEYMDVSIIIVNYKTTDLVVNAIKSIVDKTKGISYEIIVVDNNSQDGSLKKIECEDSSIINLIKLTENLGFGKANNVGLEIAKGRNILLLNPDTLLINNAIEILSEFLDKHKNVGVCGANLYGTDMKPTHSFKRILPSVYNELNLITMGVLNKIRFGKNLDFNFSNHPISVGYITGADMMIRKSILDEVGYFNPKFFMYYEETELTYRIKRLGYSMMSVPEAKIQHLEGQSLLDFKEKRERLILEGRNTYNEIVFSRKKRKLLDLLQLVAIKERILFHTFLQRRKLDYWKRKLILFKEFTINE